MPLTPPLDDEGRPIDPEQYERLCDREYREREALHLERGPALIRGNEAVAVVDGEGQFVLKLILPTGAVDAEDERWLMARAQRIRSIEKPDLRLVS